MLHIVDVRQRINRNRSSSDFEISLELEDLAELRVLGTFDER